MLVPLPLSDYMAVADAAAAATELAAGAAAAGTAAAVTAAATAEREKLLKDARRLRDALAEEIRRGAKRDKQQQKETKRQRAKERNKEVRRVPRPSEIQAPSSGRDCGGRWRP